MKYLQFLEMNRTNIRHRALDTSKQLPIVHDITEVVKKEDSMLIQIPNGSADRLKDAESERKELIEQEIKKMIDSFDKKKVIVIPKSEKMNSEKPTQAAINENNYSAISNYTQTIFERPKHYLVYSERNRLESTVKEYEANIYDMNFLKHFNFFSVEELEKIIIKLENDVSSGEMIPFERAQYLLRELYPNKEQYFEKVYQYWVTRREEFKKPLLRKFWNLQKCSDKYLSTTFRKREREKMRTRRYKKNDLDELQKLKDIKASMEQYLMVLLKCMKDRENAKKQIAILDHLNFKGEISISKNGPAIDKEWNSFINNYQKIKASFNTLTTMKIRSDTPSRGKENEDKKLIQTPHPQNLVPSLPQTNIVPERKKEKNPKPKVTDEVGVKPPTQKTPSRRNRPRIALEHKAETQLVQKKDEIERIKYLIRKDRYGRNVIHRYVNSKTNNFSPFDESFTKDLIKNTVVSSNAAASNKLLESSFQNYFERFSKERLSKLCIDTDEEDTAIEAYEKDFTEPLAANLKQFLKKKKEPSSRYALSN